METEKRASPFFKLALKYRQIIKEGLVQGLTSGRKLSPDKAFRTVPRHELVVATVCDTLGRWDGLDESSQSKLNIVALLHDADKKLEHRPEEFSDEERVALMNFLESQDSDLMAVTKEEFVEKHKNDISGLSFSQMLLYYADMIVSWDKITPFRERIAESRTRRPTLPNEFFETELKFGEEIEQRIFGMLPDDIKNNVGDPTQIPNYLINVLGKNAAGS